MAKDKKNGNGKRNGNDPKQELVVVQEPWSQIAEAFRTMKTAVLFSASGASTRQDGTRRPFMIIEQAPQSPVAHPSLVPVRPTPSRRAVRRVAFASHRNSTGSPLIVA